MIKWSDSKTEDVMDSLTYRLSRNVTFSRVGRPNLFYVWLRGHTVRLEARRVLAQTLGSTSRVIVNRTGDEAGLAALPRQKLSKQFKFPLVDPRAGLACLGVFRGLRWV